MADYHSPMRHLLLALMIVLLPLRGWVGDAMATQMASGMVVAAGTHKAASNQHAQPADAGTHDHMASDSRKPMAMHDCAGHDDLAATVQDNASQDSPCGSCDSCQACHTVALLDVAGTSAAPWPTPMTSAPVEASFVSADVALKQKPPIS